MPFFAPFIQPSSSAGDFSHWTRRIAYGDLLPNGRASGFVHLDVDTDAEAWVHAAFAGKVCTRRPSGFLRPAANSFLDVDSTQTAITLYLEPVDCKADPEWGVVSTAISNRFSQSLDPFEAADSIRFLEYRNIDPAKAKAAIVPLLKAANPGNRNNDDKIWNQFLRAESGTLVEAGALIGAAGPVSAPGTSATRQFSIGLQTRFGPFDPGSWCQEMVNASGTLASNAMIQLTQLLGTPIPLIAANRSVSDAGNARPWPWPALAQFKQDKQLAYADWRDLGDRQKSIYLEQLMTRVRPSLALQPGTTRFEIDMDDLVNLFQLEAIVEFFLNFPDPWNQTFMPLVPGNAQYQKVNLLNLYGAAAQANGTTITLDGQPDMSLVTPGRDTIQLANETARTLKQFRILGVDRAQQQIIVDTAPQISQASPWVIFGNPTLVMIDALGARVKGTTAVPGPAANQIVLQQLNAQQLARVAQVNAFDTMTLADGGNGKPADVRITKKPKVISEAATATLEIAPSAAPGSGGTGWRIPAGVGGEQGSIDQPPGSAGSYGFDHYDGMMFFVARGEINCCFPWSSIGTRNFDCCSVQGNRVYHFLSCCSANSYINLSFSVIDPVGIVPGDSITIRVVPDKTQLDDTAPVLPPMPPHPSYKSLYQFQAGPPRLIGAWGVEVAPRQNAANQARVYTNNDLTPRSGAAPFFIRWFDQAKARYYFEQKPKQGITEGIRIHNGNDPERGQNGSKGCQVSPHIKNLRSALIAYHVEANATYYAENNDNQKLDLVRRLHSQKDGPPIIANFVALSKALSNVREEFRLLMADPLHASLQEVLLHSDASEQLQILNQAIEDFQARLASDVPAADGAGREVIVPELQRMLDLSLSDDVVGLVDWARENPKRIAALAKKVKEADDRLAAETVRIGWNDAMQGRYWLIRPDERELS